MRLRDVAGFFDKTLAKDAYNPLTRFLCQLEPFDYVKIDGASVKRRVMSTVPGVNIPARGVIDIGGQRYLVGDSSQDHWEGGPVRNRYVLQGADSLATVTTIEETLGGTTGTSAYVSVEFNKYATDERDSSTYHPQYHIYFSGSEAVSDGDIITITAYGITRYYLVRNANRTMAGLVDALSNHLEDPVIDAAGFSHKTYDPITDTYTDASSSVRCLRVRWQDHFRYLTQSSTSYERGDIQLLVPTSVTPEAGDTVTLSDGVWRVLSVVSGAGYWSLHMRRS